MEVETTKFVLWAEDMSRALGFWRDAFGFPAKFTDEHWSELDLGGASLALHGGHDGTVRESGFSVQVKDLDEALREIEAAGGTIVRAAESRPGEPIRLGVARDTEGNEFMITQYVGGSR
ncbi:MAG: VOC family protein [Candidatus Eisenbacteria bacterium]|uniref:VOC family protein n=1 Tax=Eiseniibacteriota bacterium TaxID=2212470 RepID=A0A956NHZ2_UNCEI|nr:VOC family protein [Candidatus Eisenbacteria bacterium]MCB9464526.1 VOC family protein [Candidatus Eisenbacteria bacterium]